MDGRFDDESVGGMWPATDDRRLGAEPREKSGFATEAQGEENGENRVSNDSRASSVRGHPAPTEKVKD
jgi:hypothetical protein